MKHRWIPVAVVLWMLGMLWLAGVGPVGARSESDDLATQVEPELVVRPPTAWHDPICAGSKERYTLSFTNDSPEALTNVLVKDTLPEICPEGCDVCAWNDNDWPDDDCSPGAAYDGQRTVSWQFASVAPGETVTLHIEVRFWSHIPDGQVLRNCLTVTSDQLGPESACTDVVVIQCETPTPPPTITPTNTPKPPPTATPTATPEPTATPTSTTPPVYKLYLPDIYANHIVVPPTPTPTPTATATPAVPIVQCYPSEPGVGIIYRVDASLFSGYTGASAGDHPLMPITSPPAPAGWNQPAFVTDSSWRTPDQVWWPAWGMGTWVIDFPDATIIGMENSKGKAEGVDGTTHLIRQTFDLVPPEPGRHITSAVLSMWSDNKTAWWWEGDLVMNDRQQNVGQVQLFPAHVAPEGGAYLLAIQNSNDYMLVENPQGTAYRLCVAWER